MFLNCSLSQLSPHPGSWYREMHKVQVRDVVVGSYQYSIPMESYSTCNFSGGGGVFSLNPPMICTPVMM